MQEKKALTREVSKRYQKAGKKEKTAILDELVKTTGYNRKYVLHVLANWPACRRQGENSHRPHGRGNGQAYSRTKQAAQGRRQETYGNQFLLFTTEARVRRGHELLLRNHSLFALVNGVLKN
jgi:hypothetical protein